MTIVAVSMVRDEEDIVEHTVRQRVWTQSYPEVVALKHTSSRKREWQQHRKGERR